MSNPNEEKFSTSSTKGPAEEMDKLKQALAQPTNNKSNVYWLHWAAESKKSCEAIINAYNENPKKFENIGNRTVFIATLSKLYTEHQVAEAKKMREASKRKIGFFERAKEKMGQGLEKGIENVKDTFRRKP